MKKVKLVISDFHLGKGQFLPDGSINIMEEFYFDDKFIEFLEFYSSGPYAESEVELIINGDFLNLLQTDYKGHNTTVITEGIDLYKVKAIVDGHRPVFEAFKRFCSRPGKRLTYIIGNHDQGMLWPKTREFLDEVCGTRINFKNIVYFFDGVHIEHGHQHEAANRLNPKKFFLKQDLPEPILNLPWASHFFVNFILKLKVEKPFIDKIRPYDIYLRWGLIYDTIFTIKNLIKCFIYLVKFALQNDSKREFSLKTQLQILRDGAIYPDLEKAAKRVLADERVHTVIFGHTHIYLYRQWGKNKEYLNTGTWTDLTNLDIVGLGKLTRLTYALIEYPEEGGRPRARLKEWRGHYRAEADVAV
ncbi:MAG: metallophosphoesterase [Oligoflexia bacterium]|nr:metallophosphoesterase [Oligoflexia bacterium]